MGITANCGCLERAGHSSRQEGGWLCCRDRVSEARDGGSKDLVSLEAGMCLLCLGAFPIAPITGQHEVGGRAKPSNSSSKVYVRPASTGTFKCGPTTGEKEIGFFLLTPGQEPSYTGMLALWTNRSDSYPG